MKFQRKNCFILLLLFITLDQACSQTSAADCILGIQSSTSLNNSNSPDCELRSWGGFINSCCDGLDFNAYLYASGMSANQSGKIYLNSSEQETCLASMNIKGCGVEKLRTGAGGCSDLSVIDVMDKLGEKLRRLDEDCMALSKAEKETCTACLRRWEEISAISIDKKESGSADFDANICRFAVLISLTSIRLYDRDLIQAVCECLGTYSLSAGKQIGKTDGSSKLIPGLWILPFGIIGIVVLGFLAVCILNRRRRTISSPTKQEEAEDSSSLKITIKEVYMATNNLNASNYIGQGIAGKVYKGLLSNGQHVAIKHIMGEAYLETFVREVRSLSHVRHQNLVSLAGYCDSEGECFLVYELCHEGNLSDWLFDKDKVLSWIQRLKIAVDCARGLMFLHTYPGGCIIHRDIKPSNILIDTSMQAKLSDFGLSKVMELDQSFVSSEVRGTLGYIDPEYRKNRHVKASGDVYSFGIVLLQLLSGQKVIDFNFRRPMSLDKMVRT
ncbi:receptor-like protein kinase HERK 1 [Neltuma alba]|uniref:receptor-like protein kinase HERK 1 n=1 Tax=Neltuma alba TaxID=207710 RepID=UPI0010A32009|nr:receptor-like protein kinase HERK 1 [Prosopis alba]